MTSAVGIIALAGCKKENLPDIRMDYAGWYDVTDYCTNDTMAYEVFVAVPDNSSNNIFFEGAGLYNAGFYLEGLVTGMRVVIPIQRQTLSTAPEVVLEYTGNGSLEGNLLRIEYTVLTVQDGLVTNADTCIAECLKR